MFQPFIFKFWGTCPRPPLKGLSRLEKFFGHPAFKIESWALRSEASTEGILSNKCLQEQETIIGGGGGGGKKALPLPFILEN